MLKIVVSVLLMLLLAACGNIAKQDVIVPVAVEKPMLVSCITYLPTEPVWNVPLLPEDASALERLKAVLADDVMGRAYREELHSLLLACL